MAKPKVVKEDAIMVALGEQVEKIVKEDLEEIKEENKILASESQFSDRQLRFLESYLSDTGKSQNMQASIAAAGYKSKSNGARSLLGRMILNKYESSTEHSEIMRKLGYGEIWIIQRLAFLAEHAKAESVQFQALNTMAKCIGMQRDYGDTGGGTEINIYPTESLPAQSAKPKIHEIEIVASQE
jgi:hypothetical protein